MLDFSLAKQTEQQRSYQEQGDGHPKEMDSSLAASKLFRNEIFIAELLIRKSNAVRQITFSFPFAFFVGSTSPTSLCIWMDLLSADRTNLRRSGFLVRWHPREATVAVEA